MPILILKERAAVGTIDEAGQQILDLLAGDVGDEAVEKSVSLLREHQVMEEVRDLARTWSDEAVASLDAIPEGEVRNGLNAFARLMVDRIS